MNTKIKTNLTESISNTIENDCASYASLFDLMVEHPDIQNHKTLAGSSSALKELFISLWDKLEADVEKIDQEQAA
ncbi:MULTISPECIES: hypothetical protein [Methylobacter]